MNRLSLAVLMAGTVLSAPAFAQDAAPETGRWTPGDIIVTGERDTYSAEQASVTRTPVPLIEVPQSVQVITSALIKDQELVSLDEALRNVSGVVPRCRRSWCSPTRLCAGSKRRSSPMA